MHKPSKQLSSVWYLELRCVVYKRRAIEVNLRTQTTEYLNHRLSLLLKLPEQAEACMQLCLWLKRSKDPGKWERQSLEGNYHKWLQITSFCLPRHLCPCSLLLTSVIIHVMKPSTSTAPITHPFLLSSFDCNLLVVMEHLFL